jgi:hypothetical protein
MSPLSLRVPEAIHGFSEALDRHGIPRDDNKI